MNYKSILFFLGFNLLFFSIFPIFNILYSIYFDFLLSLNDYLITLAISLFFGIIFFYLGRTSKNNFALSEQIIFIILIYLIFPLLISIPYISSIYNLNFIDAYFESVSGFTTTGFSVFNNIENVDKPLILWRSSSQWIGGLMFLLVTIGTIGSKQIKLKPSYLISGGASGRNFYNNYNYNFIKILLIYFSLTFFVIFLYTLVNFRLFDSFNLAFTTLSSGGFIPQNNLSNILQTDLQIFILSITLMLPIFNFFLLYDIFTRQFTLRTYYEDLHLGFMILILTLLFYFFIIPGAGFSNVLFSITSSISTSGISNYSHSDDLSLFFILLAICGGSLISTSSGFKYTRIYILLKTSYQEIYRLVKPINVIDKNLYNSETKIDDQDVKIAFLVFLFFILSIFILSGILTFDNITFENSFKISILTLTNTTSSALYGIDNLNFFDLSNFTKISLIMFMIIGRIEIVALFYLISRFFLKE
tara:strand:+ start:3025 stop:4446 length:1422 start_codon:yes stop_codon:yes gene_type:complete